jgi:glycosyl transferase family 25
MLQFPIYYINLASRPDRCAFMEEQFARLGLSAERIEAVTPADLTDQQVSTYCNPLRSRSMTQAQYCCNLSHAKAWDRIASSGADRAVIFEDDAVLSPSLPSFLGQLTDIDIDVLRLETYPQDRRAFSRSDAPIAGGFTLRECIERGAGSAGYVMSREAAIAASSRENFHYRIVDGYLFDPFGFGRQFKTRYVDPGLCVQLHHFRDDAPEAQSSITFASESEYDRLRRGRGPIKRIAKQARIWTEYDIPRAVDTLLAFGQPPERRSIPFKAD